MNTISASQITTYDEDCNRFWYLQRIHKLQQPPAAHFTFGTVLHAVNERYLSADANQRVPEHSGGLSYIEEGPLEGQFVGRPVNLYPKGWDSCTERDGTVATVSPREAKDIQRLVQESIDNGVLRWRAGTQVEREVLAPLIANVQLIGYIDAYKGPTEVQVLPLIEDHKTFGKGSLGYLKREKKTSPNFLGKTQQMLTYAWAISELDGWEGDVTVRHNQYPKFEGREVTAVEVTIPRADIIKHGEYLRDVAERMERTRKIKDWADVPGPRDEGKCSHWYGRNACPFAEICGRAETLDAYKERLERLKSGSMAARLNLPNLQKSKDKTMGSIFDRANKQKAARSARKAAAGTTEAKAAVDTVPETSINGAEPEPVVLIQGGAPWANSGQHDGKAACRACKGRGLTSKNKACPICDNTAKALGLPTSMAYIVEMDEAGLGVAVAREEQVEALEAVGMALEWEEASSLLQADEAIDSTPAESAPVASVAPEAPVASPEESMQEASPEVQEKPKRKAKAKRRTKAQIQADEAAAQEILDAQADAERRLNEAAAADEPSAQTLSRQANKGGRPATGLVVMIGATYLRGLPGGRQVVSSSEVLARFGAELAEDMGAKTYYALDTWKRRDALAEKADYIVSSLAKHVIVHPGELGNDDIGSLMRAITSVPEGIEAVISRVG